jgi:hypothetical protein
LRPRNWTICRKGRDANLLGRITQFIVEAGEAFIHGCETLERFAITSLFPNKAAAGDRHLV